MPVRRRRPRPDHQTGRNHRRQPRTRRHPGQLRPVLRDPRYAAHDLSRPPHRVVSRRRVGLDIRDGGESQSSRHASRLSPHASSRGSDHQLRLASRRDGRRVHRGIQRQQGSVPRPHQDRGTRMGPVQNHRQRDQPCSRDGRFEGALRSAAGVPRRPGGEHPARQGRRRPRASPCSSPATTPRTSPA